MGARSACAAFLGAALAGVATFGVAAPPASAAEPSTVVGRDIPAPAGSLVAVHTGSPYTTVFGNLTLSASRGGGYLTAYTCGTTRPTASNVNAAPGGTRPNFISVRTDARGDFCVYTSAPGHVIFDQTATSNTLYAGNAIRVADTRSGGGKPLPAGATVTVDAGVLPGATVTGTLTVTAPAGAGYTTVWSCDGPRPLASTNNYSTGEKSPNYVAVRTNSKGEFCVYTSASAHLIFDESIATNKIVASAPSRIVDTRRGSRPAAGTVTVVHTGAVSSVVLGNLTVTGAAGTGYTTAYPCNTSRPATSTNNYVAGKASPNFTAVATDARGDFCVWTSNAAHLIFDQTAATSAPAVNPITATRRIDTRTLDTLLNPGTGQQFSGDVARWTQAVVRTLDGHELSADYTPGVLAKVAHDSGGNPDAVNDWDANWAAGKATFGLIGISATTYRSYSRPGFAGTVTVRTVNGVDQAYVNYQSSPELNLWSALGAVSWQKNPRATLNAWNAGANLDMPIN